MRQALGSGGVQSAGARYHRMSLVARESLGGGEQEKKKGWQRSLGFWRMGGFGAVYQREGTPLRLPRGTVL